jgi:osmoprotectant transport system permease protein
LKLSSFPAKVFWKGGKLKILILLLLEFTCSSLVGPVHAGETVQVGSKSFTESVILGDIMQRLLESEKIEAVHRRDLGGTQILWKALQRDEIDAYPEYTGTIQQELLKNEASTDIKSLRKILSPMGIGITESLGFENTYALGMKREVAQKLKIRSIQDLHSHPELKLGFSNEFIDRKDGWPKIRDKYHLEKLQVTGLGHDIAYQAMGQGKIDVTDIYTTDSEIQYYDLVVLEDSLKVFPEYQAVILYRDTLKEQFPGSIEAFRKLENSIAPRTMISLNADAKLKKLPETQVASQFLKSNFGVQQSVSKESWFQRVKVRTFEHLFLVLVSLIAAVVVSVPLGIGLARKSVLIQPVLAVTGIFQTIPSLALLVFLIPVFGIGTPAALVALFLYSLLPIIRGTVSGIRDISNEVRESAQVLGLSPFYRLIKIEVPIASRSILTGIKTAAIINVGTATLGAIIGAGGFGQPILTGIRLDNVNLILEGAVPAAALALLTQLFFELLDFVVIPKGLRLNK